MTRSASLLWFARHEIRLAWRDAIAMIQRGRKRGRLWLILALLSFELVIHAIAYAIIAPVTAALLHPNTAFLLTATGSMFLSWTLFLSQAMETATRGFYARADLDLLLSSPAPARSIFAIRIGAIAVTAVAMALLIGGPAIDAMAVLCGARFLCAYGVLVAMGATAAAMAVCATALLFRIVGAKRTRLLAQIIAAVVGAGFVIGVQAVAITSHGTMSRIAVFQSPEWVAAAPAAASPIWWPVRAAMGNGQLLAVLIALAAALLGATMVLTAGQFARNTLLAASLSQPRPIGNGRSRVLRVRSQAASLRRKEWVLLGRDPWLLSQSLMQVLYLLPPALMLWHSYGSDAGSLTILVPVLVMATGQLAGGLAWLAISGEDAPDLVGTAPTSSGAILRAKIEAVALAITMPLAPLVIAVAFVSPIGAITTIVGTALAAAGASAVQYVFRVKGKRSNFRRRQTSSRLATFAEAFVSISIAAASGLAAAGIWLAVVPMAVAGGVLLASRALAASTP